MRSKIGSHCRERVRIASPGPFGWATISISATPRSDWLQCSTGHIWSEERVVSFDINLTSWTEKGNWGLTLLDSFELHRMPKVRSGPRLLHYYLFLCDS